MPTVPLRNRANRKGTRQMLLLRKIITPRRFAAASAFLGAIFLSLLLFVWPNLQGYRQSLLIYSALNGNTGRMKLLLALGADANELECQTAYCLTPLVAAASANRSAAVQMLMAHGADINKKLKRGQTALMFASYHGDTEMVKLLIASGADVNADCDGDTALGWAKQKGHEDVAKLLIEAGATK
jgi:ankyrin repeat protein